MDASEIRKGIKIVVDNQPCVVVDFQFVKPTKGYAFTRCKVRNLETGICFDCTYKAGEKLDVANLEERSLQYTYPEGRGLVFTDPSTSEQFTIPIKQIGDNAQWLSDDMLVDVDMYKGQPICVTLPTTVELQIVDCEPTADSKSGATKSVTLSTGAVVNAPLFLEVGEWIKVDTTDGAYLERVSKR